MAHVMTTLDPPRFRGAPPGLYHISHLCPRKGMSGAGLSIQLWIGWKTLVECWNKTQTEIDTGIQSMHRAWLDGCGFDSIYDPDEDPLDKWKHEKAGQPRKLSPNARPLYGAHDVRVSWGEWGPEHITVPGNACGLDLDSGYGAPRDGKILLPHNVDTIHQAHLLLVVFTWFANCMILDAIVNGQNERST